MTNSITNSVQTLPAAGSSRVPIGLPEVAGGSSVAAGSFVDRALAEVLGADVTGGGADAPSSDPWAGIPDFVRRFLPASPGGRVPDAAVAVAEQEAAADGPPSKQSGEPQQSVQRGWAWIGCNPGQMPPPPGKGSEMPPPPGKGEPPTKSGPVDQVGPTDRGTHTVGKGEYLSVIAPRYGLSWQQLYWANRDQIKHPDLIHPGQALTIPPCDLEVPAFDYKAMFTGAPGKVEQGTHNPPATPPAKGDAPPKSPPAKDAAPPKETGPTPPKPPESDTPDAPPGIGSTDGKLPAAPPLPGSGELPPALPR